VRGSVQQGLSIAGDALGLFQLDLTTNECYSLGLINFPSTAKQLRLASFGIACMAIYASSAGWAVYASGSMANVSCNGRYHRLFCDVGSLLGHMFQPHSAWLGYVFLEGFLSIFFLSLAWLTYVRSKA
jgi:hypothetical protein